MKVFFIGFILLAFLCTADAQVALQLEGITTGRIDKDVDEGQAVKIKGVGRDVSSGVSWLAVENQGKSYNVPLRRYNRIDIKVRNTAEFWRKAALERKVYDEIVRRGEQYALRRELAEEALDYLHKLESEKLLFHDLHLELYLSNVLNRICPGSLDELRDKVLQVRITKDRIPHIELFPNGMLFLSTGLLSALESEEELIAVMADEVAHYVLDHAVQNINAEAARQRRAAFWAGVATVAAAATDVYMATQDEYHVVGPFTENVAYLSTSIAQSINARLGLSYSLEQEREASAFALRYLFLMGLDKKNQMTASRNIQAYTSLINREDLVPNHEILRKRVAAKAVRGISHAEPKDERYERYIVGVNAFNATLAFYDGDWEVSRALLNRNILQGYERAEGYHTMALATLYQFEDEQHAKEALRLLQQALRVDKQAYYLYKTQGLALLRIGAIEKAKSSFMAYQEGLELDQERLDKIRHPEDWRSMNRFLQREFRWVEDMMWKI